MALIKEMKMDQADKLRELMISNKMNRSTHFIPVPSAKGGVGKSSIECEFSQYFSKKRIQSSSL